MIQLTTGFFFWSILTTGLYRAYIVLVTYSTVYGLLHRIFSSTSPKSLQYGIINNDYVPIIWLN